jgi:hypothetical protein
VRFVQRDVFQRGYQRAGAQDNDDRPAQHAVEYAREELYESLILMFVISRAAFSAPDDINLQVFASPPVPAGQY